MVRCSMLSLAAILGASALAAQSPAPAKSSSQPDSASVLVLRSPAPSACPVSMRAQQRSWGSLITTAKGHAAPAPQISQHIHLILDQAQYPVRVTAATVTVRGTNGKWRVLTASQFQTQPQPTSPYINSTLNVVFVRDGDDSEATDLDLPGFTSVKSIRLDSVVYADGSIWTPADGRSCHVEPDPLMLVSSR